MLPYYNLHTADIDKLNIQNEFWKNVIESCSMIHFKQNIEYLY